VVRAAGAGHDGSMELHRFLERLAVHLTSWQATTFLVGEYEEGQSPMNPVLTVADGILWLYQSIDRNSGVDYVTEGKVVDRQIRNLRGRPEDDWRQPRFIATMRGRGYRFLLTSADSAADAAVH
jgi:hypothetical protein